MNGIQEVSGSIPLISTTETCFVLKQVFLFLTAYTLSAFGCFASVPGLMLRHKGNTFTGKEGEPVEERRFTNRLAASAVLMLALFAVCVGALALLCTNRTYIQAARGQSESLLLLDEGRGNIFDCRFTALTNAQDQVYALLPPGSQSYRTWFKEVQPGQRTDFYSAVQCAQPFLIPVSQQAQQSNTVPDHTFRNPQRYFSAPIAPHLIGYLNGDGQGVAGIEYAYDSLLQGGSTREDVYCVTDASGNLIETDTPRILYTQGTGSGIMLTLDATLQRICEGIASQMDRGCILVMECATGRVRASVSVPSFDPYNVAASIRLDDTSLINRAVSAYNVGSVFKPILAAAALEAGVDPRAQYECTGAIDVNGHVYHCFNNEAHGMLDLETALEQSCNCYFVQLGLQLGAERIHEAAALAGMGRATAIGGNLRTASGNLPDARQLEDLGQLASISFGQGALTATPLQVAAALNIFANGGRYVEPSFVEGVVNEYTRQVTQSLYAPIQRQAISPETAETVRNMLIAVVEDGIGQAAQPAGGGAGGKTGTAQTGRTEESGREIVNAWFAGFWPASRPQYTIAVMLDEGTRSSTDAARIFSDVASALYHYQLGVSGAAAGEGGTPIPEQEGTAS